MPSWLIKHNFFFDALSKLIVFVARVAPDYCNSKILKLRQSVRFEPTTFCAGQKRGKSIRKMNAITGGKML